MGDRGEGGCDVRDLRARLDLDSGYLSRLLRALEADGLVDGRAGRARPSGPRRPAHRPRPGPSAPSSTSAATSWPGRSSSRSPRRSGSGWSRPWPRSSGWSPRRWWRSRPSTPTIPTPSAASQRYAAELATRFDTGFDVGPQPARRPRRHAPAGRHLPAGPGPRRRRGLRRPPPAARARGRGQADVGRPGGPRHGRRPGGSSRPPRPRPAPRAPRRCASTPTGRSSRPSRSTGRPASSRCAAFNDEPYAHHWFEKALD